MLCNIVHFWHVSFSLNCKYIFTRRCQYCKYYYGEMVYICLHVPNWTIAENCLIFYSLFTFSESVISHKCTAIYGHRKMSIWRQFNLALVSNISLLSTVVGSGRVQLLGNANVKRKMSFDSVPNCNQQQRTAWDILQMLLTKL